MPADHSFRTPAVKSGPSGGQLDKGLLCHPERSEANSSEFVKRSRRIRTFCGGETDSSTPLRSAQNDRVGMGRRVGPSGTILHSTFCIMHFVRQHDKLQYKTQEPGLRLQARWLIIQILSTRRSAGRGSSTPAGKAGYCRGSADGPPPRSSAPPGSLYPECRPADGSPCR